jgi:hypothetical protein
MDKYTNEQLIEMGRRFFLGGWKIELEETGSVEGQTSMMKTCPISISHSSCINQILEEDGWVIEAQSIYPCCPPDYYYLNPDGCWRYKRCKVWETREEALEAWYKLFENEENHEQHE